MNYKAIIRNRTTRVKLMQLLNFLPDKLVISIQYRIKTGRWIDWKNPSRFTEKLQLYKIQSKGNLLMAQCADKYDVRQYVTDRGLEDILVPLVGRGVFITPEEIDWDQLPERFVLKDTLGSGGNAVIVCTNKGAASKELIYQQCRKWVDCTYKHAGREHVYDNGKHRIIIEEYLDTSSEEEGLVDYKFFCFNGVAKYLYVISCRTLGNGAEVGIYDLTFNLLPYIRVDERKPSHKVEKPVNYEQMIQVAEKLSIGFPEVRVDLFNVNGKIFFGEMTFFDGSGYMQYRPDEFDFELGSYFNLSEKK